MIIAIQDANILIDLHDSGLLDAYFRLPFETHTTDLVLREVDAPLEPYVLRRQLLVRTYSPEALAALLAFHSHQPRTLTLEDSSVLQMAAEMSAVLLTGDGRLRTHAASTGVEARGVLWLLDMLIAQQVIEPLTAKSCLEKLMACNSRLPADHCKDRLKLWASGRHATPKDPLPK